MQEDNRPREQAEKMVKVYIDGSSSLGAPFTKLQAIEFSLTSAEARALALSEPNSELTKFWQNVQQELEQMKTTL